MSKQTINIGASPNDGTGTPLRTSFDYTNQNFTELYTAVGPSGNNIVCPGTLTVSAGTLALPSLTTAGDTNTGIYFPAADTIAFVEGGAEAMRINSAGNLVVNNAATISGDLTVDTNVLKVDTTLNRVGILTASPANTFQVGDGSADTRAFFFSNNDFSMAVGRSFAAIGGYIGSPASNVMVFSNAAGIEQYRITAPGIFSWTDGAGGTRMTLNSSGNLGIGVTPSAWGSFYKAIESAGSASYVIASANVNGVNIASNCFNNNTDWLYKTNGASARFSTNTNVFQWFQAASGTAGNAITFTPAMTLDASGNLLVGVASANANGGVLQLKSGITFPATQVASSDANTLDDYEEGTFTPTITFGTLSVGVTYSIQTAIYTKVGRIIHFSGRIDLSSKGTSIGVAAINGLPFAANIGAASVGFQTSIAPSGSQAILTIDANQLIIRYVSTTTTAQSTNSDFSNSSIVIFSGTYAV